MPIETGPIIKIRWLSLKLKINIIVTPLSSFTKSKEVLFSSKEITLLNKKLSLLKQGQICRAKSILN